MIKEISIENFKSVGNLTLALGQVTVLIGENGSGKSNILEAIGTLGAVVVDKLDSEFLANRGIRDVGAKLMCSAFQSEKNEEPVSNTQVRLIAAPASGPSLDIKLTLVADTLVPHLTDDEVFFRADLPSSEKTDEAQIIDAFTIPPNVLKLLSGVEPKIEKSVGKAALTWGPINIGASEANTSSAIFADVLEKALRKIIDQRLNTSRFLIYAPENTSLRRFEDEGQIQPIGIRGEGLFKVLQNFVQNGDNEILEQLKSSLALIGWFLDFSVPPDLAPGESRIQIYDRFLGKDVSLDQRSANEGFLYLLFYFCLVLSPDTPGFFAIDNIDASLNPKLCAALMERLCTLAKSNNKQIIFTTHNPAILDGLNLSDDDQRLYAVFRNQDGRTRARRIPAPRQPPSGRSPLKLSDAFSQGLLGALPKHF